MTQNRLARISQRQKRLNNQTEKKASRSILRDIKVQNHNGQESVKIKMIYKMKSSQRNIVLRPVMMNAKNTLGASIFYGIIEIQIIV